MSVSEWVLGLPSFVINDIDFKQPGTWPVAVRIIVWVLMFMTVIGLGYYVHLKDIILALERGKIQQAEFRQQYQKKAVIAANTDAFREQVAAMEKSFGALLEKFPSDSEVPALLEDITNTGLASGVKFDAIKLQSEQYADFYIELPMEIQLRGGYHELGSFVSEVAQLSRFVTLHDFEIKPAQTGGLLAATLMAKTYRYNERE